jgi:hypothetical protein
MFDQFLFSLAETGSSLLAFAQKEVVFSTVLFVPVLILTWLLKKRSPYWHYGLWTLVLFRLILPPDFSLSFSARDLAGRLSVFVETEFVWK